MPWKQKSLKRSTLMTFGGIVVVAGVIISLHFFNNAQLSKIMVHREETAVALLSFDAALEIDNILEGREQIIDEIKGLIPELVEIDDALREIESSVGGFFMRRPEVRRLDPTQDVNDPTIQRVPFIIQGRILEENIDKVLEELARVPVLLDINQVEMGFALPVPRGESDVLYRGTIFMRNL